MGNAFFYARSPAPGIEADGYAAACLFFGDLVTVSLDTGQGSQPIQLKQAANWGLVGWSTRILDVVLDSVSQSVHHQIYSLLRGKGASNPTSGYSHG